MNVTHEAAVAEALAAIKQGRAGDAKARLMRLSQHDENSLRTLTVAHASLQEFGDAKLTIDRALASPIAAEPALPTLAVAARVAEDVSEWRVAFARYERLLLRQPAQLAFWRGLWRAANAINERAVYAHALLLRHKLAFDGVEEPSLALTIARAMRAALSEPYDIREWLLFLERAHRAHASDLSLTAYRLSALNDAGPVFAPDEQLQQAHEEACSLLETSITAAARSPVHESGLHALLSALTKLPEHFANEASIDAARARYANALKVIEMHAKADSELTRWLHAFDHTAFRLTYMARNDREMQAARGELLHRIVTDALQTQHFANDVAANSINASRARSNGKTRVAFVSKHLRDCTVGQYFRALICGLPRESFEVMTYALGTADEVTAAMEARADEPHRIALESGDDLRVETLARIATHIRNDAPQVIVYLEIGMEPLIERLAALRLAPVQCALWGHPDTTGLPTIDAFFSARTMEPMEPLAAMAPVERSDPTTAQSHYCERLIMLPNLGCAYPTPPLTHAHSRSALGLPENVPLIVCAQSSFKWRAAFIEAVATVLHAAPDAKLVYFHNRDSLAALALESLLKERFGAHGISLAERTIALTESTRDVFLARLSACDFALDTFDFSGGNTSLDSLAVGLPVLTLPGEFMRGRQTAAMISHMSESAASVLVASTKEDYVARAIALIHDANERTTLRNEIQRNAHRLFDDPAPVAEFAVALRQLAQTTLQLTF